MEIMAPFVQVGGKGFVVPAAKLTNEFFAGGGEFRGLATA